MFLVIIAILTFLFLCGKVKNCSEKIDSLQLDVSEIKDILNKDKKNSRRNEIKRIHERT